MSGVPSTARYSGDVANKNVIITRLKLLTPQEPSYKQQASSGVVQSRSHSGELERRLADSNIETVGRSLGGVSITAFKSLRDMLPII